MKTLHERFYDKVATIPFHPCWEWTGCRCHGYGYIAVGRKLHRAHRVVWELEIGPIPAGLHVCHRCDNRGCVNPAHLFLGTHRDNVDDCMRKDRHTRGERNGRAKLRAEDVPGIVAMLEAGIQQRQIAKSYGVSQKLVLNIKKGRAWRSVTGRTPAS